MLLGNTSISFLYNYLVIKNAESCDKNSPWFETILDSNPDYMTNQSSPLPQFEMRRPVLSITKQTGFLPTTKFMNCFKNAEIYHNDTVPHGREINLIHLLCTHFTGNHSRGQLSHSAASARQKPRSCVFYFGWARLITLHTAVLLEWSCMMQECP